MNNLRYIVLLVFTIISFQNGFSQDRSLDINRGIISYLIGNWTGEESGNPGAGKGYFSFKYSLDSNVVIRESHVEFPQSSERPAFRHDDMLMLYRESSNTYNRAIYFDNEQHVLHYTIKIAEDNKSIVFNGVQTAGEPVFRLTYKVVDENRVYVSFEFAPPDKPEEFKIYLEGISSRQ